MGSHCSKIGLKSVVLPSKKAEPRTVVITSKNKRGSIKSAQLPRPEEKTADTVRSPENPLGASIRPRNLQTDIGNYETTGNHDNYTDTYPIMTPTNSAESNQFKKMFQYKKGPLLGEGPSGRVLECLNLNTGELLAVKSFRIPGDPTKASVYMESLRKEISIARSLGHRNIVRYFTCEMSEEYGKDRPMADLVLEYVSGGSVRKLLDKFQRLEEKVIGTIYIRQVLEGLAYLHLNDIVHRNLKGSNILIDTTGTIKLTDFVRSGRSDKITEENPQDHHRSSSKTSLFWSAPEVIMRKSQGKPADIWSVGCVIIEMLTGKHPWYNYHNDVDEFTRQISSGALPPLPEGISDACKDFLLKTFRFDPEDRPTPLGLLEHPFLREENQETSYLEAESVNTYGTFQSGQQKIGDNYSTDPKLEKKYIETKSNNFTRKQIGTNVSMSNINIGRLGTSEFAQQNASHTGSILEPRNSLGYLQRVREAQFEDEQSPEPEFQNNFYRFGSNKIPNRIDESEEEEANLTKEEKRRRMEQAMANDLMQVSTGNLNVTMTKEERRRRLEQEMANELLQASTGNLHVSMTKEEKRRRLEEEMAKELLKVSTGYLGNGEEDGEGTNIYNIEEERQENYKQSIKPNPVRNSLFVEEGYSSKPTAELQYSAVNMNFSEYKPQPGIAQSGNLGFTGAMWNSQHFELKTSAISKYHQEQSQEDKSSEGYDPILGRRSTRNLPEGQDGSMRESETETAKKERLRRQFEDQMEVSLQRVNSERYYKDGEQSENSEMAESRLRGSLRKHQDDETTSQVLPRFSTEHNRDTWKNEEAGYYIGQLQGKKFEEDLIGFKGVWDGPHEGMDGIVRRATPNLLDMERRTPEPHVMRYNPEDSKSTQEPFSGIAGQRQSPDNIALVSPDYVQNFNFEQVRDENLQTEDQEKLGIINEAEELKEDSTYRSRRPGSEELF